MSRASTVTTLARIALLTFAAAVVAVVPVAQAATAGPSATTAKKKATPAKVAITKVAITGSKVTVTGSVKLPSKLKNTAKNRKKVAVAFTMANAAGKKEAFKASIDKKRRFTARHTTKLTGALGLTTLVKVSGRASGKKLVKTVTAVPRRGRVRVAARRPMGRPARRWSAC
jgi:hypothetical protein